MKTNINLIDGRTKDRIFFLRFKLPVAQLLKNLKENSHRIIAGIYLNKSRKNIEFNIHAELKH
jgi:hypothetical protein